MKKMTSKKRRSTTKAAVIAVLGTIFVGPGLCYAAGGVEDTTWFKRKCRPVIDQYISDRPIIAYGELNTAWTSAQTDELAWPTSFRSKYTRHACVSMTMTFLNQKAQEEVTYLCTVIDDGLPTEVRQFGNEQIASELCGGPPD